MEPKSFTPNWPSQNLVRLSDYLGSVDTKMPRHVISQWNLLMPASGITWRVGSWHCGFILVGSSHPLMYLKDLKSQKAFLVSFTDPRNTSAWGRCPSHLQCTVEINLQFQAECLTANCQEKSYSNHNRIVTKAQQGISAAEAPKCWKYVVRHVHLPDCQVHAAWKKKWSKDACLKFSGLCHMVLWTSTFDGLLYMEHHGTHWTQSFSTKNTSIIPLLSTSPLSEFQASPTVRKVPSKGPSVICSSKRWPDKHKHLQAVNSVNIN